MDTHQVIAVSVSAAVTASCATFIATDWVMAKKYNKNLEKMGKVVKAFEQMNTFLANKLDENDVKMDEFDKIAYSSFADIED